MRFLGLLRLLPSVAFGQHLLISEVAYDVQAQPEDSEYVEIFNPSNVDVVLNDGNAAYYLSDDEDAYWNVVQSTVGNSSDDWTLTFPVGAVLPAQSVLVVTKDSDGFVNEFFPAGPGAFSAQPGNPQLFEFSSDSDGVPNMLNRGSGSVLSLSNSGETVILFYWDGSSDLVEDVDIVCWENLDDLTDKTAVSVDGPDGGSGSSPFLADAGTAVATAEAVNGESIHRNSLAEPAEVTSGGNGLGGHDETTEDWSQSFTVAPYSPGSLLLLVDGNIADLAAQGAPVAMSMADGPGNGPVADFGSDGTITELYAVPEDTDGDGIADVLLVGLRGEFFTTAVGQNGSFVGIDVDPGSSLGVAVLDGLGAELSDQTGGLDTDITFSGISLSNGLIADGIRLDAVLGATAGFCSNADTCGMRGFGTDGVAGTLGNFAFLGDFVGLSDVAVGASAAGLPGAAGTSYAAPDGIEWAVPLGDLGNPTEVALVAWTSADGAADPSPNTLPENANNAFGCLEIVDEVVCVCRWTARRRRPGGSTPTATGPATRPRRSCSAATPRPTPCPTTTTATTGSRRRSPALASSATASTTTATGRRTRTSTATATVGTTARSPRARRSTARPTATTATPR